MRLPQVVVAVEFGLQAEPVIQAERGSVGRLDLKADAARSLLESGVTPTLVQVADEAGISRRTAYRYFATAEQLLAEAVLETTRPTIDRPSTP